jgi:hypothetical protein
MEIHFGEVNRGYSAATFFTRPFLNTDFFTSGTICGTFATLHLEDIVETSHLMLLL